MKRWRSRSESGRLPASVEYESALAGPAAGRAGSDHLTLDGKSIMRAMAEQRMLEKLTRSLTEDVAPMLPASVRWSDADAMQASERVWTERIARIRGDRWKLSAAVVEELRAKRYPALLMPRDRKQPQ